MCGAALHKRTIHIWHYIRGTIYYVLFIPYGVISSYNLHPIQAGWDASLAYAEHIWNLGASVPHRICSNIPYYPL